MTGDPMDTPTGRPQCTAKSKQSGERCKRRPIPDGTVCVMHGGKSPAVQAAAVARRQEREALVAAESFGLPREVDPHTALLEELHRTAGAVAWLGAIVADLDAEDVVWGRTREKLGGEDAGTTREARPNAFVSLWQVERKHLVAVAKACHDAGIEERRVRIAESAGQQLASVVRAVLERLGLTAEQQLLAREVVPEEFRRLSGDVVPGEVVSS